MATQFVNGLPIRVSVSQAKVYREVLLTNDQLIESPNSGVAEAVAFYLDGLPSDGDTFSIANDTDGSETFTFRTAVGSPPFESLIGGDADAAMTNLAAAITAQSAYWAAGLATSLDTINDGSGTSTAGYVVLIWRQVPNGSSDNDRIYGTLSTQAFGQYVDFSDVDDYRRTVSEELLAADPTVVKFGVGRVEAFLLPGERHATLAEDQTWAWDPDRATWKLVSGDNATVVIRTYAVGVNALDVVYQSASGTVDQADATTKATARALGFVKAIDSPDPGLCEVQVAGDLEGFAGLTPGKAYILSKAAGAVVAEDDTGNGDYPDAAGEVRLICGIASTADTMLVTALRELKELSA